MAVQRTFSIIKPDAVAKNVVGKIVSRFESNGLKVVASRKKAEAGTIRADFAESIDANAVHGSDAPETAAIEIAYFFPACEVYAGR